MRHFDEGRDRLGRAVETAFKFLGPRFKLEVVARIDEFDFQQRLIRNIGTGENKILVGEARKPVPIVGLPRLPRNGDKQEYFFTAPPNNPLFDFAKVCGDTVDLFQVTVSDRHNMDMTEFDNVVKGFKSVNFFMIRAAISPEEFSTFQREYVALTFPKGGRDIFVRIVITEKRMTYYDCIWPFYATCHDWTDAAINECKRGMQARSVAPVEIDESPILSESDPPPGVTDEMKNAEPVTRAEIESQVKTVGREESEELTEFAKKG
jgi:hypothetical protein